MLQSWLGEIVARQSLAAFCVVSAAYGEKHMLSLFMIKLNIKVSCVDA
jgi:hypothetical protein